jgi:hypothetical protein
MCFIFSSFFSLCSVCSFSLPQAIPTPSNTTTANFPSHLLSLCIRMDLAEAIHKDLLAAGILDKQPVSFVMNDFELYHCLNPFTHIYAFGVGFDHIAQVIPVEVFQDEGRD